MSLHSDRLNGGLNSQWLSYYAVNLEVGYLNVAHHFHFNVRFTFFKLHIHHDRLPLGLLDWPSEYRPHYALVLMCHRLMPWALDNDGIEVTKWFILIHSRLHRYEMCSISTHCTLRTMTEPFWLQDEVERTDHTLSCTMRWKQKFHCCISSLAWGLIFFVIFLFKCGRLPYCMFRLHKSVYLLNSLLIFLHIGTTFNKVY